MVFKELFVNCAYKIKFQEIGDDVDFAFVEENDTLYIYFQDSHGSKVDWRHNFSFWKKPYKDMKDPYRVHAGFMKCWKQVKDIVINKITEKNAATGEYKWNRIYTIGYSHGGALAAFCHECVWFYRADIADKCWGIAFEAPRIYAGLMMRKELRSRWKNFRVFRNRQDLVTHAPPRVFGYHHVGKIVKIGGRWKPFAALGKCIKSLFKREWKNAGWAIQEVFCILPHYPHEIVASLREFDKSKEGHSLAIEMGLIREDA